MFAVARARKEIRILDRLLEELDDNLRPSQVHALRTGSRRVASVLAIVRRGDDTARKDLERNLEKLRRRAGAVRDLDVMLESLQALPAAEYLRPLKKFERSLEHGRQRMARKLASLLKKRRKDLRTGLTSLAATLDGGHPSDVQKQWRQQAEDRAERYRQRLLQTRLRRQTLHQFRINVRHLRDVLEGSSGNTTEVARLTALKDALGAWHDWSLLAEWAQKHNQLAQQSIVRQIVHNETMKRSAAMHAARIFQRDLRGRQPAARGDSTG